MKIADIKKKIQTCNDRKQRLISLFEFDSITKEELTNRIDKIMVDRQKAEKELAQYEPSEQQKLDLISIEKQLDKFCKNVKKNLNGCSFQNKKLALDILGVQIKATPQHADIRICVPLEFITIEQTSA